MSAAGATGTAPSESNYGAVAADPPDLTALEIQESARLAKRRAERIYGPEEAQRPSDRYSDFLLQG